MLTDSEGSSSPRPPSARPCQDAPGGCRSSQVLMRAHENSPTLLGYLERRAAVPSALLHRWIRTGQVLVNGLRVQPRSRIRRGDMLQLPRLLARPGDAR